MKTNMLKNWKMYSMYMLAAGVVFLSSCGDDDAPEVVNEEEVITNVTLVFTNTADASDVVMASAVDPDGDGAADLVVQDAITLTAGATYNLSFSILNALDMSDVEDIGEEIEEEDDEHQIFFAFTDGAFENPMGNGNIDTAADPINYNDTDDNNNPVGLSTTWTTAGNLAGGSFRVRLQHQPDVKTSTSGANDGDTDFDLTFVLNIQQ